MNLTKTNTTGAIIIEGHIQGLSNTRSLGELGIPIYIIDKTNCLGRYSKYCKKFFICPDYLTDDFITFLLDLANQEKLRGWVLIPSNDHAAFSIAQNANSLKKHYRITTPEISTLKKIYDKYALFKIATQLDIPTPKTFILNSAKKEKIQNTFPAIIKGRFGLTFYKKIGKKALIAHSEQEFKQHLLLIEKYYDISKAILQEIIPAESTNKTISFTSFCKEGAILTYWMGVKLREHPFQFGTATFTKSTYVEECLLQSRIILYELKYSGVCEIEYIFDQRTNQYKLIEINPRTWLWVGLAKACGINFAKYLYENSTGAHQIIYPQVYSMSKYWINLFTDIPYSLLSIVKGRMKLKEYVLSIVRNKPMNAIYCIKDIKPSLAYPLIIFNRIKRH